MKKMNVLTVESPKKYDICFSDSFNELPESLSAALKEGCKAFVITDSNVAPVYLDQILDICGVYFSGIFFKIIEAGEASKTLRCAEEILLEMIERGFTRDDIIIALGGGVVGDLSGFCAAVYMRGIDFIQIPTTLLSQVDSSIGGKTAVDMHSYKNMIGAFHSPLLVYENSSCLKTLPKEQFLSGMGEVIKSALLGDKALWDYMNENTGKFLFPDIDPQALIHILYDTCRVKKKIVDEDPFDTGKRAVLNLGHTVGHAVEKCSDFYYTHGQCVVFGTICALYISLKRGMISSKEYDQICNFMKAAGFDTFVSGKLDLDPEDILNAVKKDKKNSSSGLKFILTDGIGNAVICCDVSREEIMDCLKIIGIG